MNRGVRKVLGRVLKVYEDIIRDVNRYLLPHAEDANLWNCVTEVKIFSSHRNET